MNIIRIVALAVLALAGARWTVARARPSNRDPVGLLDLETWRAFDHEARNTILGI
jgi:hypothetical protein